jgi:hypothetical protein
LQPWGRVEPASGCWALVSGLKSQQPNAAERTVLPNAGPQPPEAQLHRYNSMCIYCLLYIRTPIPSFSFFLKAFLIFNFFLMRLLMGLLMRLLMGI